MNIKKKKDAKAPGEERHYHTVEIGDKEQILKQPERSAHYSQGK